MGAAAIMANTALATAGTCPSWPPPSRQAIEAGRKAYLSGPGRVLSRGAAPPIPSPAFSGTKGAGQHGKPFLVDSEFLSPQALARKHQLETDPSSRKSHMEYLPGMEQLHSDVRDKVIGQMESHDPARYTARDVRAALDHETCSVEGF